MDQQVQPALRSKSKKKVKEWKVVHIISGERMSQKDLIERYPLKTEELAMKIIDFIAKKHGLEVKMDTE